jgi:hypothetical protein
VARRRVIGGDELVEEDVAQQLERQDGDSALEAGQGGMAGQVVLLGRVVGDVIEDGVGAEGVVVVLVRVTGEDTLDPGTDLPSEGVLGEVRVAGVIDRAGEGSGEPDVLVKFVDGE